MTKTLRKNRLIIAKDVSIVHVNFIVIAVTCSEKKWRHYFRITPVQWTQEDCQFLKNNPRGTKTTPINLTVYVQNTALKFLTAHAKVKKLFLIF
jgi:hypothetical protein